MDKKFMPTIRLTVEGMSAQILYFLGLNGCVLGEAIEEEVNKAVETFDLEKEVKIQVQHALSSAIQDYFTSGEGKRIISRAIQIAMSTKIYSESQKEETR